MNYNRIKLCNTFNIEGPRKEIPSLDTRGKGVDPVPVVDLVMFIEVVRPGKPLAADLTAVGLDARVRSPVPGQLVRPGELPAAAGPVAGEGLLSRVSPHVGLQVGGLGVELATARVLALEYFVLVLDVSLGRGISPGDPRTVGKIVFIVDVQFSFAAAALTLRPGQLGILYRTDFLWMIFRGNCVCFDSLGVVMTSHVTVGHQARGFSRHDATSLKGETYFKVLDWIGGVEVGLSEELLLVGDAVNSQGSLALLDGRHQSVKTDSKNLYWLLA